MRKSSSSKFTFAHPLSSFEAKNKKAQTFFSTPLEHAQPRLFSVDNQIECSPRLLSRLRAREVGEQQQRALAWREPACVIIVVAKPVTMNDDELLLRRRLDLLLHFLFLLFFVLLADAAFHLPLQRPPTKTATEAARFPSSKRTRSPSPPRPPRNHLRRLLLLRPPPPNFNNNNLVLLLLQPLPPSTTTSSPATPRCGPRPALRSTSPSTRPGTRWPTSPSSRGARSRRRRPGSERRRSRKGHHQLLPLLLPLHLLLLP